MSVTGSGKGFNDVLSKVRMNKRTKEAVQMNEAYEPTQTAVQYWDQVKADLKKRGEAYEKALVEFKAKGGQGKALEDAEGFTLFYEQITVVVHTKADGTPTSVSMNIPCVENLDMKLLELAGAIKAFYGSAKNEAALATVEELRRYVENDGFIIGMNSMANSTILDNPVLTALAMVPEEEKRAKGE